MRYIVIVMYLLIAGTTLYAQGTPPRYSSIMDRCAADRDTSSPVCNAGCHYTARTVRQDALCDVTEAELAAQCAKGPLMFGVCRLTGSR